MAGTRAKAGPDPGGDRGPHAGASGIGGQPAKPLIQIGAKSRQVIRLVRRSEPLPTYRILTDEIPRDRNGPASSVDIRLRFS
jgi:hypothetical protein